MSTPFDAIFGEVGQDLIGLFGVQQGSSDTAKGSYSNVTFGRVNRTTNEATKTGSVEAIDMSPPIAYKIGDLVPGAIEAGDCKILISGNDWRAAFPTTQPKVGDIISINGISFNVENPNPIYSGNDVAVYKMQVRQGHAV